MATSISKGCFVYKPKSKNAQSDLFFEDERTILYEKICAHIDKTLQSISKESQISLFTELLSFLDQTEKDRISTALLMLGVNVSDHKLFFKQLSTHLTQATPMIALVNSKHCTSIKTLVQVIVTQLVEGKDSEVETEVTSDDEDCDLNLKKSQHDLLNFQNFYQESNCQNKIVIILQDYESFPTAILNHFLLVLHEYHKSLPVHLIFGISTSPSIIHSTLNYDVISTIKIHLFFNQPSIECLNRISDQMLLQACFPVLLHPSILEFLVDNFLFYDFSLLTFVKGIKICVLKHLSASDSNLLCHNIMNNSLNKADLTSNVVTLVNQLDSVLKSNIGQLDVDSLVTHTQDLHVSVFNMFTALRCLHVLVHDLPNSPLGKNFRDVYCIVNSDNCFVESSTFKQCAQLLQFISKPDLLTKISSIIELLSKNRHLATDMKVAQGILAEVEKSDTEIQFKQKSESNLNLTPKSRAQLKQNLLENMKNDKIQCEFDVKREAFMSFLKNNLFKKYFQPIQSMPLHEMIMFKDVKSLKKYVAGAPRAAIHTALNNPQHYLQCDCCKISDPHQILSCMPDVAIIYKLHLECATQINIHDWLQSFSTIVSPNNELSESVLKARFTQAVSELQFLGFIKNCKQKLDHVTRLTWGDS